MAQVKPAVAMTDTLPRGVGHAMFQRNPITGLLILAGIGIHSYECLWTGVVFAIGHPRQLAGLLRFRCLDRRSGA